MVFDPEKISLIVAGAKVTGYADGSKVSAEHNKDAVTPTTGIQGDTVYALNADRSGTIKFTLFGSSASLVRLRRLAQDRAQVAVTLRNANDDVLSSQIPAIFSIAGCISSHRPQPSS